MRSTRQFVIWWKSPTARKPAIAAIVVVAVLAGAAATDSAEQGPLLTVPASPTTLHVALPVDPALRLDAARRWQLVEVGRPGTVVPVQLIAAIRPDGTAGSCTGRLVAAIPPGEPAGGRRRFLLQAAGPRPACSPSDFRLQQASDRSLKLWDGQSPVLVYNHGLITSKNVPEDDPRRSRACYVHPVWGLNGEVLTDDFPPDHYHHHGIFWTWPHIMIAGQEYDLWADRGIQQRFVRWLCRQAGPVAAVIGVENGWFVGPSKVMIERVWIRAYKPAADSRVLDLEFAWIPVREPITLWGAPGKSYGGLTMRFAPPSRTDPNTVITVPTGPTGEDLLQTPLAWADFTSRFGDCPVRSGAAVFVHPAHPDYPPTWLTRHYGPLCVGWPGIKPKTFPPGQPIRLNYRIWIHKTALQTARIQQAYEAYVAATKAQWK